MHDFAEITPLGGRAPRVDTVKGATLTEVTDRALASVTARLGKEKQAQKLISDLLGHPAPPAGRFLGKDLCAFWMGPDSWMVEAPIAGHEDLAAQIAARADGRVSVTEQTDGWCRFDVQTDDLTAVFEILCPVDLRKGTVGDATRTSIDHLGCFLLRRAGNIASVIGPRSSAGSLHHALLTALKSAL